MIPFKKGDLVTFHGTLLGKRRVRVTGMAEEDGMTGVARRFKVRIKPGVIKVPGKNIYIVNPR